MGTACSLLGRYPPQRLDLVHFYTKTARDTPKKDGIAGSFRIIVKVREMDQSIRSVAESLCLVYTLTKTRAIFY